MSPFECRRCGACCRWPGVVLLAAGDIAAAAAALGLAEEEFVARHARLAPNRAQLALREAADGACEFLDAAGRCRLYPARPRQCRDYPGGWRVAGCPALPAGDFSGPGKTFSGAGKSAPPESGGYGASMAE